MEGGERGLGRCMGCLELVQTLLLRIPLTRLRMQTHALEFVSHQDIQDDSTDTNIA